VAGNRPVPRRNPARSRAPADRPPRGATPVTAPPRTTWRRLALAPGVELHVAQDIRLPAPGRLEELAEWCRANFTGDGFETGRPNTKGEASMSASVINDRRHVRALLGGDAGTHLRSTMSASRRTLSTRPRGSRSARRTATPRTCRSKWSTRSRSTKARGLRLRGRGGRGPLCRQAMEREEAFKKYDDALEAGHGGFCSTRSAPTCSPRAPAT